MIAEQNQRLADATAVVVSERLKLFKQFRDGGWGIQLMNPISDDNGPMNQLPDKYPLREPHYLVTMPGSYPVRVKTMEQLLRIVKGVE